MDTSTTGERERAHREREARARTGDFLIGRHDSGSFDTCQPRACLEEVVLAGRENVGKLQTRQQRLVIFALASHVEATIADEACLGPRRA